MNSVGKDNMDWYLKEHGRISTQALDSTREDSELHDLIRKTEPWEDWIKIVNQETFFTLKRIRNRANELWASGSDDPGARDQFTTAVETEYQLSLWAAKEYLKRFRNVHRDPWDVLDGEEDDYERITRTCRCR